MFDRGTSPFPFPSRENPVKLASNNLSTDGKGIEQQQFKCCSSSMAEMLHKLLSNNFNNEVAHTTTWQKFYKKLLNHKLSADIAETTSITELAHKIFQYRLNSIVKLN